MPAPLRILIVDDSPEDRTMYRRLLRQGGEQEYLFVEAESGEEGLELARRDPPDCVLLDYRMPDVDGLEFLAQVTGDAPLPVIVLTGQGSEAVAVEAMKNGAQDYLLKGTVSRESLERAIRNAIEKVALRRERRQAEEALQKMYGELEVLVEQRTAELSEAHGRERDARRQAEEANRLKDEFLATLSHELRTPLNAILGWSQMLRTGKLDLATTQRALETIERNARAQSQLIADILDVSRIITGKLRLQLGPIDLPQIVESVLDSIRPAADAKSIRLSVALEPLAAPVQGDADRLQQVVWNLLSNAIKFTPRDGQVDIQLRQAGSDTLELRVSDTGIGIPIYFLPYVFDRFRQAESNTTRSHGGLGLGLSIVRHLVEQHGGTVHVESAGEGQGAAFLVRLPVRSPAAAAGDSPRQRSEPGLRERWSLPPLDGLHVLVMDDEVDTRDLVSTALIHSGARVTAVSSVAEALDALDRLRLDVLVSDIGMPGEDGYSLMRKVRAREPERGGLMPALALTAYARAEDRTQALAAGFQMHVAKPVDPAALIAAVASLAERKNLAV
ncbi:MAG TPA: response regulator [Thermoanaerobaculia bacterium]|nr:response regulator [Thermoanaerobaculia bacterium]